MGNQSSDFLTTNPQAQEYLDEKSLRNLLLVNKNIREHVTNTQSKVECKPSATSPCHNCKFLQKYHDGQYTIRDPDRPYWRCEAMCFKKNTIDFLWRCRRYASDCYTFPFHLCTYHAKDIYGVESFITSNHHIVQNQDFVHYTSDKKAANEDTLWVSIDWSKLKCTDIPNDRGDRYQKYMRYQTIDSPNDFRCYMKTKGYFTINIAEENNKPKTAIKIHCNTMYIQNDNKKWLKWVMTHKYRQNFQLQVENCKYTGIHAKIVMGNNRRQTETLMGNGWAMSSGCRVLSENIEFVTLIYDLALEWMQQQLLNNNKRKYSGAGFQTSNKKIKRLN